MGAYTLYEKSGYGATLIEPLKAQSIKKINLGSELYKIVYSSKKLLCKLDNRYVQDDLMMKSRFNKNHKYLHLETYCRKNKRKTLQMLSNTMRYKLW